MYMKNYNSVNSIIVKNNKINYILAIVLAALTSLCSVGVAIFLKAFIDIGISEGMDKLLKLMLAAIAFVVVSSVISILGTRMLNRYIKTAVQNLKNELINRILLLKIRDFKKKSTGSYISMLSNDMTIVEQDYIKGRVVIVAQSVMVVFGLTVMIYINWKLTLCVLLSGILPVGISAVFGRKLQNTQSEVSENNRRFITMIKDIFTGISVIKSFNIEKEITDISTINTSKLENKKASYGNLLGMVISLTQSSTILIVMILFLAGAWLTLRGEMTIGGILAFVQLLNNVTSPINILSEGFSKMKASKSLLENFEKVTLLENCDREKVKKSDFTNKIKLESVAFSYNDDEDSILKHISLEFEKGKSYAIVGLSGSGKSTLLNLLAGYYEQYEGSIYVDDEELRNIDESSISELLSIVHQESFMFDDTIYQNIELFKSWPVESVNWAIKQSGLDKLLSERGNDVLCGENGSLLSGGEKQRISIARALLRKAPILLMDEATASLDMQNTYEIEKSISAIEGITKIVITHKLDGELLRKYDSIVMLKEGMVIEKGNYDELINKKGEFYSLCKLNGEGVQ